MTTCTDISPRTATALALAVTVLCAFGYLRIYLASRSLWLDEAMLAVAVLADPAVLAPLPYGQMAPLGFVALVKWMVHAGFNGELALRLISLVSASLTPWVTFVAARNLVSGAAAVFAALFTGLAPRLVYFSSEFKPYSLDILVAASLIALAVSPRTFVRPRAGIALLVVASGAASWLSFPSVFVLVGVWLAVLLRVRQAVPLVVVAAAAGLCLANFFVAYTLARSVATRYDVVADFWAGGFLPFPPASFHDASRWLERLLSLFVDPFSGSIDRWSVGTRSGLIVKGLWAAGVVWLARTATWRAILLAAPLLATVAAAALQRYPASGRLIAFLIPILAVGTAAGLDLVASRTGRVARNATAALLLMLPVVGFFQQVKTPSPRQEIRPVLESLATNVRRGDAVYLYNGAVPAFEYYLTTGHIAMPDGVTILKGQKHRSNPQGYIAEICSLPDARRFWLVISHEWADEEDFLLAEFAIDQGTETSIRDVDAAAYRVDRFAERRRGACGA